MSAAARGSGLGRQSDLRQSSPAGQLRKGSHDRAATAGQPRKGNDRATTAGQPQQEKKNDRTATEQAWQGAVRGRSQRLRNHQLRAQWSGRRTLGSVPSETVASVCPQRWEQGYLLMRKRGLGAQGWAELSQQCFWIVPLCLLPCEELRQSVFSSLFLCRVQAILPSQRAAHCHNQ